MDLSAPLVKLLGAQSTQALPKRFQCLCQRGIIATFRQVFERSICRISPHKTFPGPTSIKVCTPLRDQQAHALLPLHRSRNLLDQCVAGAIASVTKSASTLQATGYTGLCT